MNVASITAMAMSHGFSATAPGCSGIPTLQNYRDA
jgi:hypothetical protein